MKCVAIKLLVEDYIDGDLDEKAAVQVKQHLEQCIICRSEVESIAKTVRIVQALKLLDPFRDYTKLERRG